MATFFLPSIYIETDANTHPHYADLSLVHKQIIAAVGLILQAVLTHAYRTAACPDAERFHTVTRSHCTCAMVVASIRGTELWSFVGWYLAQQMTSSRVLYFELFRVI